MGGEPNTPNYSVRAVHRVCDILDLLQNRPGRVSLAEVAETTGLPKSSVLRYLATLEARRYVQRDPATGDYDIGLALLPRQAQRFEILRQRVRPLLERLHDAFDETINLGILDGTRVYYLESIESSRGVRLAQPRGHRDPIHSTALGKAIAAQLPSEQVSAILTEEGMESRTSRTITRADAYFAELAQVRQDGYALDDTENDPDGRCLAVALAGTGSAVSLSAPASRFVVDRVAEVAQAVRETAVALSALLAGPDTPSG